MDEKTKEDIFHLGRYIHELRKIKNDNFDIKIEHLNELLYRFNLMMIRNDDLNKADKNIERYY